MTRIHAFLFAVLGAMLGAQAFADPVVYTVQTVMDGSLGSMPLNEALVRFTFVGDTQDVHTDSHGVSSIHTGKATISVLSGNQWLTANFARGQVYVRYDVPNGIVGFASVKAANPFYPFALDCGNLDCSQGSVQAGNAAFEDGIAGILDDILVNPTDAAFVSAPVGNLQATLTKSTLLTGFVHSCAGPYAANLTCTVHAAVPLVTDHGDFYAQDMSGTNNAASFLVSVQKLRRDD